MKNIIYYLLLLIFIGLLGGFLLQSGGSMGTTQLVGFSVALVIYTTAMALVDQEKNGPAVLPKQAANRIGLIVATAVFTVTIIYRLAVNHQAEWWSLSGLISVNLAKLITLIFLVNRPASQQPETEIEIK